jgi:hypothetical protein
MNHSPIKNILILLDQDISWTSKNALNHSCSAEKRDKPDIVLRPFVLFFFALMPFVNLENLICTLSFSYWTSFG